ncbi:hypothetical protein TNIN_42541 [Trichonephila inaurata madagascariensis]|uniref:Uncharacterized protein n=1 Tax=Trichonephila inaurata madagascariensis TaxID=2747483 RepID=A0A8X7CDY9_9ARAC|nr:hypothetical protein TNIN_42541 [Trichonephila inaurata madagascariensis]
MEEKEQVMGEVTEDMEFYVVMLDMKDQEVVMEDKAVVTEEEKEVLEADMVLHIGTGDKNFQNQRIC